MSRLSRPILIAVFILVAHCCRASDTNRVPTVAQIWFGDSISVQPLDEDFRAGLKALGYTDGRNIRIVARYANGDVNLLRGIIDEMIRFGADLLFVSPRAGRLAKERTTTVPIVCPSMGNPLVDGLVASLAHPAGNVTGLYWQAPETQSKRLELTMELLPRIKRLALLFDSTDPIILTYVADLERLAQRQGVKVRKYGIKHSVEMPGTIDDYRQRASACIDRFKFSYDIRSA